MEFIVFKWIYNFTLLFKVIFLLWTNILLLLLLNLELKRNPLVLNFVTINLGLKIYIIFFVIDSVIRDDIFEERNLLFG